MVTISEHKRNIGMGVTKNNTILLSIINIGCSSMTDSNRQLNEPITGAYMIGRDAMKSLTEDKSCAEKSAKEQAECQKEVDELSKAFDKDKRQLFNK